MALLCVYMFVFIYYNSVSQNDNMQVEEMNDDATNNLQLEIRKREALPYLNIPPEIIRYWKLIHYLNRYSMATIIDP